MLTPAAHRFLKQNLDKIVAAQPAHLNPTANVITDIGARADRILNGASPVRVLLCDKYVRGDDNLESLALLVRALRSCQPSVAIDIWTSEEDADFNKIATITGSRPSSYREAFVKSFPHDRYLLVVTNTGEVVCWQMSNSPLHARPDIKDASHEAPLRWKDLFAANLPTDELMPALRQWVKGK